jgi:predicted nucleotidyltransferase
LNLNRLKKYFRERKEVAFAFLFGSSLGGQTTSLSDVDIAVYFYPSRRGEVEFEEPKEYPGENEIWADLERILHKPVDLLILNRAPATIAESAIAGKPIVIKNWTLYLKFMCIITSEAIDFREMLFNHYQERQKIK